MTGYAVTVRRGDSLRYTATWSDQDGNPVDTTGMTFQFAVWDNSTDILVATVTPILSVAGNVITINVPGSVTNDWTSSYFQEIRYKTLGGETGTVLSGSITATEVRRDGTI
jgi:hypothetical protein